MIFLLSGSLTLGFVLRLAYLQTHVEHPVVVHVVRSAAELKARCELLNNNTKTCFFKDGRWQSPPGGSSK